MYTLVALGNKGEEYARTRHNAARILAENIKINDTRLNTFIPDGYMNESGSSVSKYLRYKKDTELIVMYDDKDLPIGTIRVAYNRGAGGHNGLRSIIEALGRKDFIRIRIGIGPKQKDGLRAIPPHGKEVQEYVLHTMGNEEINTLLTLVPTVKELLITIVESGHTKAMEKFNQKQ